MVKGGLGAAALTGLGSVAGRASAATGRDEAFTGTLRVITLGVEWPQGAEQQAEKDLGFKFNVQPMSTNAQVQKSITAPTSFDIGGLYNYQFFQIWPTGNFQPVDRNKIKAWNSLLPGLHEGQGAAGAQSCTPGQGNAPYRVTFVDTDGTTGLPLTKEGPRTNRQIVQWWNDKANKAYDGRPQPRGSLGPAAHFNMDSMGYNGDEIKKQPGQVSWAELLNAQASRAASPCSTTRPSRWPTSATPSRRSG